MALSPDSVILYAADESDYALALGAAAVAGIPVSNVTGNFYNVWNFVASGDYLVIAVGGPANTALYYNPCGWANPANEAGGSTPFYYANEPQAALPGANAYENGAGNLGEDTLKLVTMLAYYAVNGSYPPGYGTTLPTPVAASTTCSSSMKDPATCPC